MPIDVMPLRCWTYENRNSYSDRNTPGVIRQRECISTTMFAFSHQSVIWFGAPVIVDWEWRCHCYHNPDLY